jgi:hypothetical protein
VHWAFAAADEAIYEKYNVTWIYWLRGEAVNFLINELRVFAPITARNGLCQ